MREAQRCWPHLKTSSMTNKAAPVLPHPPDTHTPVKPTWTRTPQVCLTWAVYSKLSWLSCYCVKAVGCVCLMWNVRWGEQGFKQLSEPRRHRAFCSKQNPLRALYEEVLNAVFKIQLQTAGWMHLGKERAKHNTVKLCMKTERLQEGGSIWALVWNHYQEILAGALPTEPPPQRIIKRHKVTRSRR